MRLFVTLIGTVVIVGGKNNAHKFIPGVASKVENDEALLEKLRAKASSGNNQANVNRESNPVTKETIQPRNTTGFDDLFEKEHNNTVQKIKDLEELKRQELEYQQLQKMLADDNDKFNKVKQRLEMSQQSPRSDRLSSERRKSNKKSQVESDSRSTLSNQSSRSVISVNKTLQSQLNKNTIKASSISFGSSAKGKKPNVNIGSR
jgi:oligoribonuclease NrnB/cAMP/cGMP phosphodiesterase (DHH superfamily)